MLFFSITLKSQEPRFSFFIFIHLQLTPQDLGKHQVHSWMSNRPLENPLNRHPRTKKSWSIWSENLTLECSVSGRSLLNGLVWTTSTYFSWGKRGNIFELRAKIALQCQCSSCAKSTPNDPHFVPTTKIMGGVVKSPCFYRRDLTRHSSTSSSLRPIEVQSLVFRVKTSNVQSSTGTMRAKRVSN